jgi:hypothetical protein
VKRLSGWGMGNLSSDCTLFAPSHTLSLWTACGEHLRPPATLLSCCSVLGPVLSCPRFPRIYDSARIIVILYRASLCVSLCPLTLLTVCLCVWWLCSLSLSSLSLCLSVSALSGHCEKRIRSRMRLLWSGLCRGEELKHQLREINKNKHICSNML